MARYLTVVRETVHRYRTVAVVAATKKAARETALEKIEHATGIVPDEEVVGRLVQEIVDRDLPENAALIANLPLSHDPDDDDEAMAMRREQREPLREAAHAADDEAADERRERQNELDRELMPAVGFDPDDA